MNFSVFVFWRVKKNFKYEKKRTTTERILWFDTHTHFFLSMWVLKFKFSRQAGGCWGRLGGGSGRLLQPHETPPSRGRGARHSAGPKWRKFAVTGKVERGGVGDGQPKRGPPPHIPTLPKGGGGGGGGGQTRSKRERVPQSSGKKKISWKRGARERKKKQTFSIPKKKK